MKENFDQDTNTLDRYNVIEFPDRAYLGKWLLILPYEPMLKITYSFKSKHRQKLGQPLY